MPDQAKRHSSDSQTHDSLNTKVVPIVLVPGVMGTRLATIGGGPNWDPDSKLEMLSWIKLSQRATADILNADRPAGILFDLSGEAKSDLAKQPEFGVLAARSLKPNTSSTVAQVYAERGWGEVAWGFYKNVLMQLERRLNPGSGTLPYPVHAVGYDWRGSCRDSGRRLRAQIQRILSEQPLADKVLVVTHSMGGLVTRAALRDGAEPLMAGVIHCVQPANGAPVAYRRFQTGAVSFFDATPFTAAGVILTDIMGVTRLGYTVTQARLRGPVELLPNNNYPDVFVRGPDGRTNQDIGDIFDMYLLDGVPGVMPKVGDSDTLESILVTADDVAALANTINRARSFHRFLGTLGQPTAHAETAVLFGNANVTDLEFDWNLGEVGARFSHESPLFRGDMELKAVRQAPGDGTVPAASARFGNANPTPAVNEPFGVEHAACFEVAALVDRVEALVREMSGKP